MALDGLSVRMIWPILPGRSVLSLGYPTLVGWDDSIAELKKGGATEVDIVDVIRHRGMERLVDLNEPQEWPRRYGLVINPGTLEHCFNIAQAFKNSWDAVEVGGYIMQIAPVTLLNHGFWNINPISIAGWCEFNGGRVEEQKFAENGTGLPAVQRQIRTSLSGRGNMPSETVMYALCRKVADVPTRWPVQGQYRT